MRFSNILFLIPLIYAEPCYPSIRPSTNSHISPCNSKPLIVYKPYLRYALAPLRKYPEEEEDEEEKEDEIDDEYIISIE